MDLNRRQFFKVLAGITALTIAPKKVWPIRVNLQPLLILPDVMAVRMSPFQGVLRPVGRKISIVSLNHKSP